MSTWSAQRDAYDPAAINADWGGAWPADASDVTDARHAFSPVLQAPVANLLGTPWYLECGSPGGDYVTWLDVDGGGRVGISPHPADDGTVRWAISWTDEDGNPLHQEHELSISAPPVRVAARVRAFLTRHHLTAR